MHDSGYDGGIVFDPINGGVVDTRALSRRTIDDRFYNDLITSCNRQIGWNAPVARAQCYTIASTYYLAVRAAGGAAVRRQSRRSRCAVNRHPSEQLATIECLREDQSSADSSRDFGGTLHRRHRRRDRRTRPGLSTATPVISGVAAWDPVRSRSGRGPLSTGEMGRSKLNGTGACGQTSNG